MVRPGRPRARSGRTLAAAAAVAAAVAGCGGSPVGGLSPGGFVGPPPEGALFGAAFVPADACAIHAAETTCRFPAQGTLQAAGLILVLTARPELGLFMSLYGADCVARAGEASVRVQMLRAGPPAQLGGAGEVLLGTHAVNTGLTGLTDGTLWGVEVQAVLLNGQCRELRRPSVTGSIRLDYATAGSVRGALDLVTDDGGFLRGPFEVRTCPAAADTCAMVELPYCAVQCFP